MSDNFRLFRIATETKTVPARQNRKKFWSVLVYNQALVVHAYVGETIILLMSNSVSSYMLFTGLQTW